MSDEFHQYHIEHGYDEECPEEPECPCQKFVISTHGKYDEEEPLDELREGVGMGDSSLHVAVLLVEDAERKHQVMNYEEEQCPLDERQIKPFGAAFDITVWVGEICFLEEISCCDEEYRHMEQVDEIGDDAVGFGVAYDHENDGDAFDYGYAVVAVGVHGGKVSDSRHKW